MAGILESPFQVNEGDEDVITYSVPLFGQDGRVRAVFGVEISVSYLYQFLPASELQTGDSYGYVIGYRSEREKKETAVTALQGQLAGRTASLRWSLRTRKIPYIPAEHGQERPKINACVNQMGMYYHNTVRRG